MKKLVLIGLLGMGTYGGAFGSKKPVIDEAHFEKGLPQEVWDQWRQLQETGDPKDAQILLQNGFPINARIFGNTLLYHAVYGGHLELVKFLVKQEGIDINIKKALDQYL